MDVFVVCILVVVNVFCTSKFSVVFRSKIYLSDKRLEKEPLTTSSRKKCRKMFTGFQMFFALFGVPFP